MHDPEHSAPPLPARSTFTPYIALWAVLAVGAMGYIGWVATNADRLAASRPPPLPQGETNEGQRAKSDALAEMKALRETVGEVQRDVAQLKTDMQASAERSQQLVSRIAALEETPGKTTAKASAPAPAPPPAAAAAATDSARGSAAEPSPPAPAQKSAEAKSAEAKAPALLPKVLNAKPEAENSLETGSVAAATVAGATAPVVFGPAVVKPAPKPVGIRIATGPSVDSLRLSWSLLADRHADQLKNLEARYITGSDAAGTSFDLVAGPLKSQAEAKRVCATLEAKQVPCRISDFKGDAL